MEARRRSGIDEIDRVIREVSASLERPVDAYLIGGLAMIHHGLKIATKDVDVVLGSLSDCHALETGLEACGFVSTDVVSEEYRKLGATRLMERSDGMRFDIFLERVCRKLRLTRTMMSRATPIGTGGNLRLRALAPGDLFLFKSVTDREDDLADMALLAGLGLDWSSLLGELMADPSNCRYLPHLASKLTALEEVHGVVALLPEWFDSEVELMLGVNLVEETGDWDTISLEDVTRMLGEGDDFSRSVLDRMVALGIVLEEGRSFRRAAG